jgi:hypothetical protein
MGEVKYNRVSRVYSPRYRILTPWEDIITIVWILARLTEDGIIDLELWGVADSTANPLEDLLSTPDSLDLLSRQLVNQAEGCQFSPGCGAAPPGRLPGRSGLR